MAVIQQQNQYYHHHQTSPNSSSSSFLLDALYCEEERWEEEEVECLQEKLYGNVDNGRRDPSLLFTPPLLLEQDLFWEDEELLSLFSKEEQQQQQQQQWSLGSGAMAVARREMVEWVMKVNAHYGFSALTAILAVNYLDRFLSSRHFQGDKPWMIQLVAVTCLSLAAKVEETQMPLILDLQVEDTKYVFEAKTIQRMELLVLSTLQWKMNPVTPLSFVDHIIRRLGLKTHLHWEFLRRCERLLLSVVADSRFVRYPPSVLATATMLHVINHVEPCNPIEYQNQLLGILKIDKDKVTECHQVIMEISTSYFYAQNNSPLKRKYTQIPGSPNGVVEAYFSSDSSNDSWAVESSLSSSSPVEPVFKKSRTQEKQMRLPSLNRVIVDAIGSSPR